MEICNGQYKQNQSKEVTESKKNMQFELLTLKHALTTLRTFSTYQ